MELDGQKQCVKCGRLLDPGWFPDVGVFGESLACIQCARSNTGHPRYGRPRKSRPAGRAKAKTRRDRKPEIVERSEIVMARPAVIAAVDVLARERAVGL